MRFRSYVTTFVRYRYLLLELVVRDIRVRYRGSLLGFAWTLLNPILFMAIYTLVFSVYLRSGIRAYPLFLLSGLIPWMWFSGTVVQATTAILDGRAYVGKTLLPTELLILVPVLSNGLNFVITVALLFPVAIALHTNVIWAVLYLPILTLITLCMTLAVSLVVATFNVFYRDLQQLVGYAITALFFLTPIFYARTQVPEKFQFLVTFNPLAAMVGGFQDAFFAGVPPNWKHLAFAGGFAAVLLFLALNYFDRHRDAFGEYL